MRILKNYEGAGSRHGGGGRGYSYSFSLTYKPQTKIINTNI